MDHAILVVDDDPAIRTLVTRVLTRSGYQVREAEDGVKALKAVASRPPALVLSDIHMPYLDGCDLAQRLVLRPEPIPCILMSGTDEDPHILGVPFLAKPFTLASLLDLVTHTMVTASGADALIA